MSESDSELPIAKWIGVAAAVLAPTTLITGLCFYFGYVATRKTYAYFGVSVDSLGFTNNDYVMRSVSILYAPVAGLIVAWWIGLWIREAIKRAILSGRKVEVIRRSGVVALIGGFLLLAYALLGLIRPGLWLFKVPALTPVALGAGAILVATATWILSAVRTGFPRGPVGQTERASQIIAALLLVVAMFWLTNILAEKWGAYQAERFVATMNERPSVVLDLPERLFAPVGAVRERALPTEPGQEFAYRYECLRVLTFRAEHWYLVPWTWTEQNGFVLVVQMDDSTRVRLDTGTEAENSDACR